MYQPMFVYNTMADGTLRILNPVVGEEVWSVPGRSHRPIPNARMEDRLKLNTVNDPKKHCHFCHPNILHTPVEKERVVVQGNGYALQQYLTAEEASAQEALFRRVPNLFEIIPFDFWQKNYGVQLSDAQICWRDRYLSTSLGRHHILTVITEKLERAGLSVKQIAEMSDSEKLQRADAFFGGAHELIIASRHLRQQAEYLDELCSSGALTNAEHSLFLHFTIRAVEAIYRDNSFVRYVSVYQNWLKAAGASFDHLHKQVLGVDSWGSGMARRVELLRRCPNLYNDVILDRVLKENLIVAENSHAIAWVEPGHRFPALAVYSKSAHCAPWQLAEAELSDFSDLVHAMHAAGGAALPCNEEWYFQPRGSDAPMPFHILIKWRINIPAGFEGSSHIFVNPLFPSEMKERVMDSLVQLRQEKRIGNMKLGDECEASRGCLHYNNDQTAV